MDLTADEITLCKQIAERHTAESGEGDWFIYEDPKSKAGWSKPTLNKSGYQPQYGYGKNIPLWTISDCLEFFNERGFYLEGLCQIDECEFQYSICEMDDLGIVKGTVRSFEGKTPLEACLIAVLAVLEEVGK